MSRRLLVIVGAVAVAAALAIGLSQAGSTSKTADQTSMPLREQLAELEGAPAPLAELHGQASRLLDGNARTVEERIDALRAAGYGVVVNKWAAWCPPCRLEFPVFQRVSVKFGKRVAFLGLDGKDNHDAARRFLDKVPVSYPSYKDPNERTARALNAGTVYPVTVFVDRQGKRTVHQGPYDDEAVLERDIERYALGRA